MPTTAEKHTSPLHSGKQEQKLTFFAFTAFFLLISFLYLQKHGFDGGVNAQQKAKMDSLQLVNWRLQRQLEINSDQATEAFGSIRDNYFDAYDRNFYRMYGLFRDVKNRYSKTEVSVMFNIFNPNAIESKEVQGERWFLVPVKGVHSFKKTETLSELATLYYANPADSNLIRKFNPQIEPGKYLFIPFDQ